MTEPEIDARAVVMLQAETMKRGQTPVWTVYERPKDYPAGYVARMFTVGSEGERDTGHVMHCLELEPIREKLHRAGLVLIPRDVEDEPQIIESWM
jgi:hypothetical protein